MICAEEVELFLKLTAEIQMFKTKMISRVTNIIFRYWNFKKHWLNEGLSQMYVYLCLKHPAIYFHPGLLPSAAHGSFPGPNPVQTTDTPIRLVGALTVKGDHL